MNNVAKTAVLSFFVVMFGVVLLPKSDVHAQSAYFTTQGCTGCHASPVTSTCNGCHAHGTHASSTKSGINVTGTTSKTSYAPGEAISVTITGGYRTGWVRAVLYDQNSVELARSTGTQSGMGSSTTLPATLTATAPTTPGTYTWKVGWYGNQYDTASATFGAGWTPDPTNPNHGYEIVSTNSFTVTAPADTTIPVVSSFTLPATATSLTVPVSAFTATDNVAVTGYLITTSATAPAASAAGWTATAPANVTAVAGANTFYAWAKDAAGNVSAAKSASVTVTLPDTTIPVVSSFTLPATANSLTVPVSAFVATDNVAVTGYLITTSSTAPAASAAGWTATAPANVTAVAGANTFYAWAKDAAGNVSAAKSASVTVTLPDTTIPVVSSFTLPATATSLTVPVSAFVATDNVAVTGYLITTSSAAPAASAAGWTATAPANVTAVAGANTFYAWAKDAAGNVSASASASVTVTLPDTTVPVVSSFTLPATATSLTVPVSAFVATDNVAVTGYLITTSSAAPAASAAGWTATAPASVTAVAGANTFYAWAKDAAGNVSAAKSASVTVTLPDTAAPVVSSFTLPSAATSLTVPVSALVATDNVAVTGYLITTSSTAPAASAAGWTATAPANVTAVAGANTFYAWAKDAAGNVSASATASVIVTLPDTTAPVVSSFTLPATATSLTVPVSAFVATDNVAVTGYLITTSSAAPTASAAGWTATAPANIPVVAGANTFYAWAKDAAGNVSAAKSASVSVTIPSTADTTNPTLTISALASGSYTNKVTLNISGNASDASGIKSVTVNGQAVTINPDGSFSYALDLTVGINTITTIATDNANNQQTDTRTVTYDPNAPVLAVSSPDDNSTTLQSFVTVAGTIDETSTVTVSVNNDSPQSASITGNSFSATVYLVTGVNTITINATDLAGNTTTAKRTVTYSTDNSLSLAVTSPSQDITTNKSSLILTGKVAEDLEHVTVKITMNGKTYKPKVHDGAFKQRLTFKKANTLYAITVTAKDAAGNTGTVTRNVIYRPASPEHGTDD